MAGYSVIDAAVAALQALDGSPRRRPPAVRLSDETRAFENRLERDFGAAMRALASGADPESPLVLSDRAFSRAGRGRLAARYDTALTTDDNRRHWSMADGLAPDAAANPNIRYILRIRSRYEVDNNSYARGMIDTLANDLIGTGPRLQLLTEDEGLNSAIEDAWNLWAREIQFAEKLRTIVRAKKQDGEAFTILVTNNGLDSPVQLDLRTVEADQVRFVDMSLLLVPSVDGIQLDDDNNPVSYHVLKVHPGFWAYANGFIGFPWEYDVIPARSVIHWFKQTRPGQHRGIPETLAGLPLFAQLRRYTQAVLDAAEAAADNALVIRTNAGANVEPARVDPMDTFPLERRMATTLPAGWDISQIKAEQPSTTYEMFKREILCEIARGLGLPYNVAAGDSSDYNYASGRLDHQTYFRQMRVEQAECETKLLDRVLFAWFNEAILASDLLPLRARRLDPREIPHIWRWDGHEHVDPLKEAQAQATRLSVHATTLAAEYGRGGLDWEKQLRQRAKEIALMKELGLSPAAVPAPGQPGQPGAPGAPAPAPEEDNEEAVPVSPDGTPTADESEDI